VQERANTLFTAKAGATTDDQAALRLFINSRYREFYESFFWPEWMTVEKRTFRPAWDGTATYAAGAEAYYWPTQSYFQALVATMPLTISTLTRAGTTATVTFGAAHRLVTNYRVQISGVSPAAYNGIWPITVTTSTAFTFTLPSDPGADGSGTMKCGVAPADTGDQPANAYWAKSESSYGADDWSTTASYVVGNQVYQPSNGQYYQCHTAHTSQQPPNATYWGVLTEFERRIDYSGGNQGTATNLGRVRRGWDANPKTREDACSMPPLLVSNGVIFKGTWPYLFVEFRLRPNDFTGSNWASGSFAVGDVVYYTTTGEFYRCIAAATTEVPTDTTKWLKMDFPLVLREPVAMAAMADMLKVTGKTSKWATEFNEARRLLHQEFDRIERQQGQTETLNVMTR
jgi:hypothetical protein